MRQADRADEELLEAIRLAARGETYLNPKLGARIGPVARLRPTTGEPYSDSPAGRP